MNCILLGATVAGYIDRKNVRGAYDKKFSNDQQAQAVYKVCSPVFLLACPVLL